MRTGICITLQPADRRRLATLVRYRKAPHKHVWRAEIVLLSADGIGTNEIMRRTGKSKTCVWRWQERFMQAGYDGLLRDKTRPSRIPPLGSDIAERVVALTRTDPPVEATHWTASMMAKAVGISASSVQRIWARAWSPATPGSAVQALQRPEVHRHAARRGRALWRSARPCHRPLGRRKGANPGARPHAARPADEEGPRRHDDPRLQTTWHNDAVRRSRCPRRQGHWPLHAAPSSPRVYPLPQRHRGAGAG